MTAILEFKDVPSAIAAAKCWLHRNASVQLTKHSTHPRECGWCAYPSKELINAVSDFMESETTAIESFSKLATEDQHRLVLKAQDLVPVGDDKPRARRTEVAAW